jgi:putative spermidine/putrescine transport system permease protein
VTASTIGAPAGPPDPAGPGGGGPPVGMRDGRARQVSRMLDRHPRARLFGVLTWPTVWLLLIYVGSLVALFVTSFYRLNEDGTGIVKELGVSNYRQLIDTDTYRTIALRTLWIAVLVTVIDVALALPIAYYIAKVAKPRWRPLLAAAVLVPLWGSYLVKAFAWRAILGDPGGVLAETVGTSPGYGLTGVVVVLAYLWLPYMILPIYAGLERLPDSLLDASGDLGAGFVRTLRSVVIPVLVPSIVAGAVFTFSLSLGDYIAVQLVGGPTQTIGSVVYANFTADLPFAAAYAVVPVVIMVVFLLGIRRTGALDNL